MLTLKRRVGERIVITTPCGEEIVIEVARIDRNQVALRVGARREVKILREEVQDGPQVERRRDRDAEG